MDKLTGREVYQFNHIFHLVSPGKCVPRTEKTIALFREFMKRWPFNCPDTPEAVEQQKAFLVAGMR